jgi:hypothetical protein
MAGGKRMIGKSPQTDRSTVCLPEEATQKRTFLVDSSSVRVRATAGGDGWREGRRAALSLKGRPEFAVARRLALRTAQTVFGGTEAQYPGIGEARLDTGRM